MLKDNENADNENDKSRELTRTPDDLVSTVSDEPFSQSVTPVRDPSVDQFVSIDRDSSSSAKPPERFMEDPGNISIFIYIFIAITHSHIHIHEFT